MDPKKTDVTLQPDLQDHWKGTGPHRSQRPVYQDFLPPCNAACPAGENIQAWLSLAQEGKYKEAWEQLVEDNPLPAIHGRVCYHPCESSCNRAEIDSTVSIHSVERFLGDMAIEEGWNAKPVKSSSGKKILVVGAGPSGLSAAWQLRRMGHEVEIREAGPIAGGMMHFGIPAYRLPRDIIYAEVKRLEQIGVKITLDHKVSDLLAEKKEGKFDAVFLAIGAHIGKKIEIPARDAGPILDAVSFLREVDEGNPPQLGRRVAIYGGGNTAMDTARSVKRLGIDEALIIYRRDRDHMPAHESEADEALAEGIKINWLRTIKSIEEKTFTIEKMRIENGRPIPTGEFETLEADALLLALGQDTETDFLKGIPGIEFKWGSTVVVGPNMMTGAEGIFAGGDMVPSEKTVTVAVGHGKKAARFIDAWLQQGEYAPGEKHPVVGPEHLQLWYRTHAPQTQQAELPIAERVEDFSEIVEGLSEEEARFESQRCLSCGNCFECDGCYGVCPEDAVIKLGPGKRYRFDYELCTGCAACFEQCPCHAIEMVPEN